MVVLQKQLGDQIGKEILVVQVDGKAFKGRLSEFDTDTILLTGFQELKNQKWITPSLVTSEANPLRKQDKPIAIQLREVLIQISSISRIYPLTQKKLPEKPMFQPPATPPQKKFGESEKYVIRSGT